KLDAFEEKDEYLVQGCTLIYVAEKLNSNTTYLSKVINTYKGKTFNAYLNELRINKALLKLKSDVKLRSYTIQGIAEEFGFKRQETFSRAFKQQTGIYPSQYLKKLSQTAKDD
ncbi:MAG: helix-turn-helix domain-containing protein, partial [Bacteroidota bacterium]